jgi:SAM-dependent methyltransferase
VQARVWAEVLGDEYPAALSPYSYVSVSELHRFVAEVEVSDGEVLVDVGCGRGGPGLWVAARRGARLIGVDIAETALDAARERAAELELSAEFRQGSFQDTGLATASAHAVMSVDALLFALNKPAALGELARILRPAGRLVLTTWDYFSQPAGRPPQVSDHRPLLKAAGFEVLAYEETEDWLERQIRIAELLLDAVDELAAETGADPAVVRASLEEMQATIECMTRRVLIVASRVT